MSSIAKAPRELFDLVGDAPHKRFSPFCFRVKLALLRKGLEYSSTLMVPVLRDGTRWISDSLQIQRYLDATYPATANFPEPIFPADFHAANFLRLWVDKTLHAALFRVLMPYIYANIQAADQAYFRQSREARVQKSIEDIAAEQGKHRVVLNATWEPLRALLAEQDYLAGGHSGFADDCVLSAFLWAECVLPFDLLEDRSGKDASLAAWRQRMQPLAQAVLDRQASAA
jgi:glutathione S-transferase